MSKRLYTLIVKDTKLIIRNWFLFITLFVAVLFIIMVRFVIPEELSLEPTAFILDAGSDSALTQVVAGLADKDNGRLVKDRTQLEDMMRETTGSLGIIVSGSADDPDVEFVMQGYENSKVKALLTLEMNAYLGRLAPETSSEISLISGGKTAKSIPFNHSVLPLFLLMEPVLLGLFFIATLMFFEKTEGTTRAYAVSPGRLLEFLLSKVVVMFLLGLFSMSAVTLLTVGLDVNMGFLLLIALAGSLFGSSLGLLISSMFDNLSKAMVWILSVSLILSAPFASYYMPSFSPVWIKVMPTYTMLFALKEAIYQTGQTDVVWQAVSISAACGIAFFGGALLKYKSDLA